MSEVPEWFSTTKAKSLKAVSWEKRRIRPGRRLPENTVSIRTVGNYGYIKLADNLLTNSDIKARYSYLLEDKIVIMRLSSEGEGYPRLRSKGTLKNDFPFPRGLMNELDIQKGRYPAYLDKETNSVFINVLEKPKEWKKGSMGARVRTPSRKKASARIKPTIDVMPSLDSVVVKVRCPKCGALNVKDVRRCKDCGSSFYGNEEEYREMLGAIEELETTERKRPHAQKNV